MLPWQQEIQWKTPFILDLDAQTSKTKSVTPNFLLLENNQFVTIKLSANHDFETILWSRFTATLTFWKIKVKLNLLWGIS